MATLTDLRSEVLGELGLDTSAGGTEELRADRWLNRGIVRVLLDTHCYVVAASPVTPGASEDYTVPSTTLDIVDIQFVSGAEEYGLERVSIHELRRLRRITGTGATRFYAFQNPTILWYPTPGAADTFEMYHIPRPTVMSSGAHDSSNATYGGVPEELSYLIEYWAKAHLASYDDDQSSAQGLRYLDQYWTGVGRAKGDLTRKGGRRLPRVVVGRRPRVASSPSQDI